MSRESGSTPGSSAAVPVEDRDGFGPWRGAVAVAARVVVGAGSVALGVLVGMLDLASDVPIDWAILLSAAMLTLGGTTLLALPRLRPEAGRSGWFAGGATTLIGLALAVFLPVRQGCCDAAYTFAWGLPHPWNTSSGDTPGQAYAGMLDQVDTFSAGLDALFWTYAGLIVGVAVGLVRRAVRPRATNSSKAAHGN
ncbi:hypothetical protein ACWKSP_19315 [Micromonosporaceae bacterium Da 78-11]